MKKLSLVVKHVLVASHSLEGYEKPHPHLWKLELRVSGQPVRGRVIDLPALAEAIKRDLEPMEGAYLNTCEAVDEATRAFPTCETLGSYLLDRWEKTLFERFRRENPSVRIVSLQVTLCNPDGFEFGAAIIEP